VKLPPSSPLKLGLLAATACVTLGTVLWLSSSATHAGAQGAPARALAATASSTVTQAASSALANAPARPPAQPATNAPAPASANAVAAAVASSSAAKAPGTQTPVAAAPAALAAPAPVTAAPRAAAEAENESASGEIPLSLQNANIDMVVQWLAKQTGKSVLKHPKVQCQLTIVSSKKLPVREAVSLVYRALALEGFSTIETSKAILITPEGQEPKTSPELIEAPEALPEGRQRLIKIFHLEHVSPADIKEKLRGVLSEKATIETDDHGDNLIVTDYTDNVRLAGELIKSLDAASSSEMVIEVYPVRHAEADELATLLGLIMNAQGAPAVQAMPGQPMPGRPMPGQPMPGQPMPGQMMPGQPGRPGMPGAPAGAASEQVHFWPDKTANRLIVSAPKSKLPEIRRLLDILDTEKPQDVAVRVLPLKHVAADDLVKEIGPLYQKVSGKSVKDTIEVTGSSRANSLIVLSSEANFQAIQNLIAELDTEEAQEKAMQAFPLKNADAEDVAKQLKELSQDQDSQRYPYYIFSYGSGNGNNSQKMSVVADRRRNTVIVQAPPASMAGIAKMIQTLDEPVSDDALAPSIFRLKYVSAVDIEDVLNELFLKKQQQRSYYFFDEYPQETPDRNVGRLYGKVRITSEPYSNSIIVTSNSKESLAAVEEVIKQLDAPSEAGESTLRVGLKFAKSAVVANSINILFAKNGSPPLKQTGQPGQPNATPQPPPQQGPTSQTGFDLEKENTEEGYYPWLGSPPDNARGSDGRTAVRPVSDLVGRVRAVADLRSNALLISANVHFFPQILKLIADLDAPTEQVLIEARLVEVSNDYLDKLGVRWSPDGSQVFTADDYDNSILAHASGQYQKGFGGTTTANTPASANGSSLVQTLASLRSGVLDASINMDYLVQFLRKTTDAKVLAEPQINIRDNETGRLFVGQEVPIPQNTVVSQLGGQNTSFTYKDVGVVLEVTPHINAAGDVELSIHAESSTVVPGETVLGGSVFDTRNFRTDLTAKNGQTLVLGGIIQKQISNTLRKTPLLGDIPGLGWAFKKRDKTTREVELMVFMRPKVTHTAAEAQDLLDEIYKKAPGMRQWNDDNEPGHAPPPGHN
jgi:type II secretion system protein D